MKRRFAGLTDKGLVRAVNQDNYYADPDGRFFVVADGMGGHAGGQEASKIATEIVRSCLSEHWETQVDSKELLKEAFEQANQAILNDQDTHPERSEMGTTAVVVIFRNGQPWCAHVGDSRLYRFRQSQLEPITEDHTWVAWAMKTGTLTPSEASVHPLRHVLSQCLGRKELYNIEIQPIDIFPGDYLLLCSDGLTGEVNETDIGEILSTHPDCEEAAGRLIEAAKRGGGSDNITAIVVLEAESKTPASEATPVEQPASEE